MGLGPHPRFLSSQPKKGGRFATVSTANFLNELGLKIESSATIRRCDSAGPHELQILFGRQHVVHLLVTICCGLRKTIRRSA